MPGIPIASPFSPSNPTGQAICAGVAAPSLVWQPGGTSGALANTFTTEALLQQACTTTAGMAGSFPVYVDFSHHSDAYTAAGALSLGSATRLIGMVNQSSGNIPALTTSFTLSPLLQIHDIALQCRVSSTAFTSNPYLCTISGQSIVTCESGSNLYEAPDFGGFNNYQLFLQDEAVLGDGTNPVITVGSSGYMNVYVKDFAQLKAGAIAVESGGVLIINAQPSTLIDPSYGSIDGVTINIASTLSSVVQYPGSFTDWADLVTFVQTNPQPTVIVLPPGTVVNVPPGSWNLGVQWSVTTFVENDGGYSQSTIELTSGASLVTLPLSAVGINFLNANSSAVWALTGSSANIAVFHNCAFSLAGGGAGMFDFSGTSSGKVTDLILYGCTLNSGRMIVSGPVGTTTALYLARGTLIGNDVLAGTSSTLVYFSDSTATVSFAQTTAFTNKGYNVNNAVVIDVTLTGSSPFTLPPCDIVRVSSSALSGAVVFNLSAPKQIVDLEGVSLTGVSSLKFQYGSDTVTVSTPTASSVYLVWYDGGSYVNAVNLNPPLIVSNVVTSAPTTTSGVGQITNSVYDWPVDTSGGSSALIEFPASPVVGQQHCIHDVGGGIVAMTSGSQSLISGSAQFVSPTTPRTLVNSWTATTDYWSYVFTFTAKGIWSLNG